MKAYCSQEPLGLNSSLRLSKSPRWPSPRRGWGYNLPFVNLLGLEPEQLSLAIPQKLGIGPLPGESKAESSPEVCLTDEFSL